MKDTTFSSNFSLNFSGKLTVYKHPIVMGIINVTPDSFYAESRKNNLKSALSKAEQMISEGVDILDIGGYSSRPGADDISRAEETERVVPIIAAIRNQFPSVKIAIDTFRTDVAEQAILAGANMINDISGGVNNSCIYELAAKYSLPYIMMHMKGTPQNMVKNTDYKDLVGEMLVYFSTQIEIAKNAGLKDIIIDPGIGFSKTIPQNFELIQKLRDFTILRKPILAGVSRKSFIYKTLGIEPAEALTGTTALNTVCLMNGAKILRVHDVKEAKETINLLSYLN